MSSREEYKFSWSGSLLAVTHPDGRLGVWSSSTSQLVHQYVPSSHLSASCTCLAWAPSPKLTTKKKKKKDEASTGDDLVALGTTGGTVLLYSSKQGDLVTVLSKPTTSRINAVTWSSDGGEVWAAGQDGNVAKFSISKLSLDFTFSAGTDPIFSLVLLPESRLATASRSIKIWQMGDKRSPPALQQTLSGHATEVVSLGLFTAASANYVISAAADDRTISVWRISQNEEDKSATKSAWASLSVNEGVRGVSVGGEGDGNVVVGVVTKAGALQVFKHHVGERRKKPIKPKHVIQVASEKDSSGRVMPIPVMACHFSSSDIILSHGSNVKPFIETLPLSSLEKEHCLVREAPISRLKASQQVDHSKTITPDTNGDVVFLAPGLSQPAATGKLGKRHKSHSNGAVDDSLPVEERLALLSSQTGTGKAPPRTDTLAQLLVQGLHGKDGRILDSVLDRADDELIDNTVRRIPAEAVVPLVKTLQTYVKGRGMVNSSHAKWLRSVLTLHTGFLVSVPDCQDLLGPVYALLEARTSAYSSVLQLRGKLDLVIKQKSGRTEDAAVDADQEALLVYQDESSDELSDVLDDLLVPGSDTDDNWDDEDEEEEDDEDVEVSFVNGDAEENEIDMDEVLSD